MRKHVAVVILALVATLIVGKITFTSRLPVSSNQPTSISKVTQSSPQPPLQSSLQPSPTPYLTQDEIQLAKKTPTFRQISIQEESPLDEYLQSTTTYAFFNIGKIKTGKYADYDIILVKTHSDNLGKYFGRHWPAVIRFLYKNDTAIILKQNSNPNIKNPQSQVEEALHQLNITNISTDSTYTIPLLSYPTEIKGQNQNQKLIYKINDDYNIYANPHEDTAELNSNYLTEVFESPYGKIYTTNSAYAPQYPDSDNNYSYTNNIENNGTKDCSQITCFNTNNFFLFRPDGTYLELQSKRPYELEDITWDTSKPNGYYYANTIINCTHVGVDVVSVAYNISTDELIPIGKTNDKNLVYTFKNSQHPILKNFYNSYSNSYTKWYEYMAEKPVKKTYEEYIQSVPIFFIKDEWNRLIRYTNSAYLEPSVCEPIIYLYPQSKQQVNIKVNIPNQFTQSWPSYKNGWDVTAFPDGVIYQNGQQYPYLFWEAFGYPRDLPKEGFIVKQSEIANTLALKLRQRGLNEKETHDFLAAWTPKLAQSPYYLMSFIPQKELDRNIPLAVSPTPDTSIRVYVEFIPINKPINIRSQQREKPPKRNGFTLVEWGGILR